jgi:hypothetical protein
MGEQIAVNTRQNNTGQTAEIQDTTRYSLPTTLECNQSEGYKDQPTQGGIATRPKEGNNESGNRDTQGLNQERRTEHPSPSSRESTVEGGEAQRTKTKARDGHTGFDPAIVIAADQTQTKVNRVSRLHANEGAPDKHSRAVK